MADYGIKISEAGYDVKTCDDVNLILKSSFTLLKTKVAGTVSLSGVTVVAHGLGYKPQFLVYGLSDSSPDYITHTKTSNPVIEFDGIFASVDDDYLYIYPDSTMISAYYFVFYEGI